MKKMLKVLGIVGFATFVLTILSPNPLFTFVVCILMGFAIMSVYKRRQKIKDAFVEGLTGTPTRQEQPHPKTPTPLLNPSDHSVELTLEEEEQWNEITKKYNT